MTQNRFESQPVPEGYRLIDVGDAALAVRTVGQGPDLVFVHGFPVHGETWRKLLPRLAEQWTCHVFDLAGFGLSRWDRDANFNFTSQAARLHKAVSSIGLERYALVAHNTGATVARWLCHLDPDRVTHLTLINTEIPGHRPPWIPLYQSLCGLPFAASAFQLLMRSRTFRRSPMGLGGLFTNKDLLDGEFQRLFIQPLLEDRERMQGLVNFLRDAKWDVVDAMAQMHATFKARVQMIWGEDCVTFPLARAEQMIPQFRNFGGLTRIKSAALMPHEEQPAAVLDALIPFLNT
jgi:pimeloyl-ACP methyl ester carboxylesterase